MRFINEIENCIPASYDIDIKWDRIHELLALTCISDMKFTQQNPVFHGEGNVYTHTKLVCSELVRIPAFYELSALTS